VLVTCQALGRVLNLKYWCYREQTLSDYVILIVVYVNHVLSHGHVAMLGIAKNYSW